MIRLGKNTQILLKLFFSHPEDSFYIQQIGRIIKKKPGVFQRCLYDLEKQGILKSEFKANARFFHINKDFPVYKELKTIIFKGSVLSSLFLFLVFSLIFPISSFSQSQKGQGVILNSLEDAVSLSLKNNKDIQIQERQVNIAKANIMKARSPLLPQVDLNFSYTHNAESVKASPALSSGLKRDYGVFVGYENDNNLGISVTEDIYNGGANIALLRQARIAFAEEEQALRATSLNVEFETKRLYYGILLAYETKRIAEDLVKQAKAHYEDARRKFEQGTVSRFDVLQSKVQVSLLIPELVNADNAIELIKAELNKVLGLDVLEDLTVNDSLAYRQIEIKEGEFLKEAYLNKPEMILKSLNIDLNKWGIRVAKSGWYPQVSAAANYNYRSNNWNNMFNTKHNNWNIGVAVTLPIFDGFATKAKVDAAKLEYAQSIISKDNLADQVAVDVRNSCLDLKQAEAIIESQRDNLEDAREALKIAEVRFDNGIGVNLDVLDAQVSLAKVEQNLAGGIYDYLIAKAQLDRTMGKEFIKEAKNNENKN